MVVISKAFRAALGLCRWLDNHWIGDLIGAFALFASGYAMIFMAGVLQ